VKKPQTAETAEFAEKKTPRILGVLCVLCGKTALASHALRAAPHLIQAGAGPQTRYCSQGTRH